MHWVLLLTFMCTLCSIAFSAPQEIQDAIKEEPSMDLKTKIVSKTFKMSKTKESEKTVQTEENSESIMKTAASRAESQAAETGSEKPVEVVTEPAAPTKKPIAVTKPTKKPLRITTVTPVTEASPVTSLVTVEPPTTVNPNRRYPCQCGGGLCSCCTGLVLENFNVPIRSRACANVTYEPDDFAFNFKLLFNNRVLYNSRMSAKNPRPVCVPINRYFGVKMCVKLSNIYMSGRNIHACLDMEGYWDDESAFDYSFNCFRIGSNGVGIVRPEDGGGLPPPPDEEEQTDEDYDDSARAWTGDVEIVPI